MPLHSKLFHPALFFFTVILFKMESESNTDTGKLTNQYSDFEISVQKNVYPAGKFQAYNPMLYYTVILGMYY